MSSTKYFVQNGREFVNIDEYFARELDRAGYGRVELHKTPMGHRVVIHAMRLGMVIGKAGKNIKRLTEDLEDVFGLESPQLEVKELENPDLVARVQASKLLSQIERGFHELHQAYPRILHIASLTNTKLPYCFVSLISG